MRIFSISDLHVDFSENLKWVTNLSRFDYQDDVILVAGDLTHEMGLLEKTLIYFKEKFKEVFYVPGNHDLWLKKSSFENSLDKFFAIVDLCSQTEVHVKPTLLKSTVPITIFPVFSWYTLPDGGKDSLYWPKKGEDPSLSIWNDTHFIKWPQGMNASDYFLSLNDINQYLYLIKSSDVISFSHFLPRQDLMYVYGKKIHTDRVAQFNFTSVAGSSKIDTLIRKLDSRLHLYGHHHRNQIQRIDGITYVSACLGYPYEHYSRKIWNLDKKGPLQLYGDGQYIKP